MRAWRRIVSLFILTLAFSVITISCGGAGTNRSSSDPVLPDRPNVVLIMADDLGFECLSAYGSASYATPNLDLLASDGARFLNCHAQPLCTPTRVQIMTGRYNFRNYKQFGTLAPGEKTFAHMLQAHGYATGVFGKWQLDGAGGQKPRDAGFDRYCLWNYAGVRGNRYGDPKLVNWDAKLNQEVTREYPGQYGPDLSLQNLIQFMEQSIEEDIPFFVYYPMILPHNPFKPTPNSPEWEQDRHAQEPRFFGDMVEYVDTLVGRVVGSIDELGARDRTLIIFTGDNGTNTAIASKMQDGSNIQGGKGFHTDAGTRVPLIVNWRGVISPGQIREEPVDSTDFLPTVAAATGAILPEPPGDGIVDGISFLWSLIDGVGKPRPWIYVGYTEQRQEGFGWPRARFVRDQRYKLYGFYEQKERKSGELIDRRTANLYDLVADPTEQSPISSSEDTPETALIRANFQDVLASLGREGDSGH